MKTRWTINSKNLPIQLPLTQTITLGLLLDRLHASALTWGAAGMFCLIIWICIIWLRLESKELPEYKHD